MSLFSVKKLRFIGWRILVPTVMLFTLAACGGEATSIPTVPGEEAGTPFTDTPPTQLPTSGTALTPAVTATPTTAATEGRITPGPTPPTPVTQPPGDTTVPPGTPLPLELELLAPQDGAGVETGALRVLGQTRVDAVVGINGVPVEVSADGRFTPNPPKDTDGRREDSGRVGEGATGEMAGLHWGRLEVGGRSSVAA